MFFKKKKEEPASPAVKMPDPMRQEMYQAILDVMKTALADPNCTMTPEQLFNKINPGVFTAEECAKLLKEATEQ